MKEKALPFAATGAERRSTRVAVAIPLTVTWTAAKSKTVREETATLSISCHGCRYFSTSSARKDTRVTLQTSPAMRFQPESEPVTGRIVWIRKSRRLGGKYQVGLEFDTPRDIWHLAEAPGDWAAFSEAIEQVPAPVLAEMAALLEFATARDYYQLLGVNPETPRPEVKRQFYQLASRFHPDHHMDHPEWTSRLVVLMDALATAYKTLSDQQLKAEHDARVAPIAAAKQSTSRQSARECVERSRECLAENNYIGSVVWLRRAIEAEPNSSSYRAMLGHSLAAVPEYRREAVDQFERAIDLDASNIAAHFYYGQMLESMKLPRRARQHYLRVLELDMDHRDARERLNRIDSSTPRSASRTSLLSRLTGRR